jgi:ubiquinone/menaquinone biosynthesis C-methylase UbiE
VDLDRVYTFLLCGEFQKVIGVDVSEMQIEPAKSKTESSGYSNVEFTLGDAHSLPIESSSVDLLTCGTAWHWLDPEIFYTEAKKLLKPGDVLLFIAMGSMFNTTAGLKEPQDVL